MFEFWFDLIIYDIKFKSFLPNLSHKNPISWEFQDRKS